MFYFHTGFGSTQPSIWETDITIPPLSFGTYNVKISEANGNYIKELYTTEFKISEEPTNIDGFDKVNVINIYPNPCTSKINLNFHHAKEVIATLYDIKGEIKCQLIISNEATIEVSSLKPGIYLLKVCNSASNEILFNKIIIKAN